MPNDPNGYYVGNSCFRAHELILRCMGYSSNGAVHFVPSWVVNKRNQQNFKTLIITECIFDHSRGSARPSSTSWAAFFFKQKCCIQCMDWLSTRENYFHFYLPSYTSIKTNSVLCLKLARWWLIEPRDPRFESSHRKFL